MIEVEAKAHIRNLKLISAKAKQIGKYVGKENKVDDYYTLENLDIYPKKSLRVRAMNGYHQVNFKKRISYVKGIHAKKEVEFKIRDLTGFFDLLKDFGFRKWLRKEKITYLYKIEDNFHIELNKVKNLGWFVEVEYLCKEKDIPYARKRVLEIIKKLNINKKDLVKNGYTKMLWDKRK